MRLHHGLVSAGALILAACSLNGTDTGRDIQAHNRQTIAAPSLRSLRVENVVGSITITGSKAPSLTIDSTKYASRQSSIDNTQIVVDHSDGDVYVHTHYAKTGWFGSNGAGVDYVIGAPENASVHLANVSGPITVRNVAGDVEIQEVSGSVHASAGRLTSNRYLRVNSVSGPIDMQIARNSDATVDIKSVSGSVHTFFPVSGSKGFVGQELHGRVGNGSATIDVNSVSGPISITSQ